ncbi:Transcription initiation factor TFIID subunit 5 [Auxenochlorella protothecoides]|uniref:Transcription initiation factor TFIID subunit 5 n=2 Tax=Auxenochlorella protothecoides TaxID=3075 RepID=A0A087SM35_AUXPR|nr:Transcription initiation factor TFIID subunit 5 [Auxenochlorella protothecoides]KFM26789.1 Transcription initiation factor TFIID subunit 5 [Auxenochlorella protothecoides]
MSLASTAAVDRLVLQYLKRRRLHEAGKVLSLELRASCAPEDVEMQAWSEVNDGDDDGALLEALALDGSEPAAYARAYTAFAAWVDASLDLYKPELACLLYPVLVHVSLSLVERGAASEAHALLAEHGPRFAAAGSGPAAEHRARELQSLQTLTGREQLAGNAAAAAWRARRAGVRLSAYSHGLLLRALQTPALQLILGVVNGHGSVEDAWAQAKFDRLEREAAAEADAGAGSADGATKKQRAALAKAAADAKAQRESVAANRMACEIPLPPRTEEESAALASELDGRVAVSPSALPSALLCTFVNTHASLAAAAVALDARCVAGGFADGSVRLHDLGQGGGAAAVLRGHEAGVHGVALSPDASLALSCSADGSVRLWSRALGAGLVAWRGAGPGASPVWDVAWCPASPAGHYFATGGADRALRVWSVERARALRLCAGAGADVDAVAWHPNAHVATPVLALEFSHRNLLLGAGALALYRPRKV